MPDLLDHKSRVQHADKMRIELTKGKSPVDVDAMLYDLGFVVVVHPGLSVRLFESRMELELASMMCLI